MLAIFAPQDESIDSSESMAILADLAANGSDIRLIAFPGYDHSMRRLAPDDKPSRFAGHPVDYFSLQAAFIRSHVKTR